MAAINATSKALLAAAIVVAVIAMFAMTLDRDDRADYARRCADAGGEVLFDQSERIVACVKPGSVIELRR